jgi:capsular exopolysaccharide synthesis family protein
LKQSYFSRIKRYSWIVLSCVILATIAGVLFVKIQKSVFQVSSTMYVVADAPTNGFNPTLSANDSIGLAANYASEIMSRSVMEYVYKFDPQLQQHGYAPDDLLANITVTASDTTSTFTITASATNASDAVLLANDVAKGFQSYIQAQLQHQLDALRTNLQNQYAAAQKQKGSIEASLVAVASNTDPHFTVYEAELNDVIHTLDSLQGQLVALPATADSNVVLIQLASAKDATLAVKSNLIIALSASIGLLIGILVMLLVIYLDNLLSSEDQVREKLRMAYLGGISRNSSLRDNPALPNDRAIHELADICANLPLTGVLPGQLHAPQGAVLLITSPRDAEGKTTIAVALAASMARGGRTVVIVDGNLERPETHLALGVRTSSGAGLASLLESKATMDNAVQRTAVPGLWLLSGGTRLNAPSLLLEQKLPLVLEQLRKKADIVVIDGPALLSGAEASILASMADGVALVVDSRHDKLTLLQRAKELLDSLAHVPVGVILNRFPQKRGNSYYAVAVPGVVVNDAHRSVQVYAGNTNGAGNRHVPASVPAKEETLLLSAARSNVPSAPDPARPAPWPTPVKPSLLQYVESADSQSGGKTSEK